MIGPFDPTGAGEAAATAAERLGRGRAGVPVHPTRVEMQ